MPRYLFSYLIYLEERLLNTCWIYGRMAAVILSAEKVFMVKMLIAVFVCQQIERDSFSIIRKISEGGFLCVEETKTYRCV